MAGVAGFLTKVRMSGTAVAFLDESMTNTSGNTYRIDDTSREVWDPDVGVTFEDNGVPIPSSEIERIDYMFGIVEFNTAQGGPVTVSGSYVPLSTIAGGHAHSVDMNQELLDDTDYAAAQANGGYRTRVRGIRDVEIQVERWEDASSVFFDAIDAGTKMMVEIQPGGTGRQFRGWYHPVKAESKGEVGALEENNITFQLASLDQVAFSVL